MSPAELADKVGRQDACSSWITPWPPRSAADGLATARAEQVGSAAFEATAVAVGSPALKVGHRGERRAGSTRPSKGKWVITGSRHEFGAGTYRTALEFTGRQDRSLHGLVAHGGRGPRERNYGVVVGHRHRHRRPRADGPGQGEVPVALGRRGRSYWARLAAPGRGEGLRRDVDARRSTTRSSSPSSTATSTTRSSSAASGTARTRSRSTTARHVDSGTVTYCGFTSRTGHKVSFFESDERVEDPRSSRRTARSPSSSTSRTRRSRSSPSGKLTIEAKGDVEIKAGGSHAASRPAAR